MRTALALLVGLALIAFLVWRQQRRQRVLAEYRGHLFDDCLGLFENPRLTQTGIEFPRLVGSVRGEEIQVTPVIDTLTARKLPSLWLMVTLVRRTPLTATIDVMMRPSGMESFSNFHTLRDRIALPPGWPGHAVSRTDDANGLPPASVFDQAMAFFDDPRAKEFLASPKGVRLVTQADQGERSYYVVYRQAVFAIEKINPNRLSDLIDRLFAINDGLEQWKSRHL